MNEPRVDHPGRILEWLELPARFEEPRLLRFVMPAAAGVILPLIAPLLDMRSTAAGTLALLLAATAAAVRAGRLERRWLEVSANGLRIRLSRQRKEAPVEIPWDAIIEAERSSGPRRIRTAGQPRRREEPRQKAVDRTVLRLDPERTPQQLARVTVPDVDFGLSGVGLTNLLLQVHAGLAGAPTDLPAGTYLREGRKREPWNGDAWTYEEAEAADRQLEARLPRPVYRLYRILSTLVSIIITIALLAALLLAS